ncbi:MAG: Omp28-related outer membrane protein, partial [Blastocatellia bacterium]
MKEAEKSHKQANENDPTLASAIAGLAAIAERNGDREATLDYLTSAAALGPTKEADRKKIETLYRQTRNGSLAGLEEMLDAKYRKLNPPPLRVEPYKATPAHTGRVVLAELFTGSGCRPCVAADLGFDALLERYGRRDFALLTYHLHVPLPDPMTNPSAQTRARFYGKIGTPTYAIDGSQKAGGGSKERTRSFFGRNNPKVEDRLASPPEANLKLAAALEGGQVKAKVTVEQVKSESPDLKLQIALVENELRYTGENGVRFHSMVVRSLGGKDALGFPVATQGQTAVEWTFDLKAIEGEIKKYLDEYEKEGHRGEEFTFSEKMFQLAPNNLSVVAFVQDEKSKKVLQAAYVKIHSPAQEGGK